MNEKEAFQKAKRWAENEGRPIYVEYDYVWGEFIISDELLLATTLVGTAWPNQIVSGRKIA